MESNQVKLVMEMSVETLAQSQHDILKSHVLETLSEISNIIKSENYNKIYAYLSNSPSGDGMGEDNYFIEFGYNEDKSMDIEQICVLLNKLKESAENLS